MTTFDDVHDLDSNPQGNDLSAQSRRLIEMFNPFFVKITFDFFFNIYDVFVTVKIIGFSKLTCVVLRPHIHSIL